MGKLRIHELAKKMNLSNQELIQRLQVRGMEIKSHSSTVDEAQVTALLNAPVGGDADSKRTRTMLRRRRPEAADEAETVSMPVVEDEPVVELAEPIETPIVESHVLAEESPAHEVVAVEAASVEEVAVVAEPAPVIEVVPPSVGVAEKAAPGADDKSANTPVVRMISADAIRARLAAEGRTFRPRGVAVGQGRPVSQIREISVVHNNFGGAPQMVDVTGQKAGGGARPGKKKTSKDYSSNSQERREQRSGGFELWLEPSKRRKGGKRGKETQVTQAAQHKRVVEMEAMITVGELARRLAIKGGQLVTKLMSMGTMATVNQSIDFDTASIIAAEFGYEVKNIAFAEEEFLSQNVDTAENVIHRAPIVTVMGHVDHGKTSVLDAIRLADVARGEAGGITQHIGAYSIHTERGDVTFLDTPGHEAFTAMRARGAKVTDIVVLVVAADDGVMPQTIEAVAHAKAAKVPVIVAINKMDLADAKPERVMQQLADHGLVAESWGGDVQMVPVSARKKTGLTELIEAILNLAEMMELKANPDKMAQGTVIEAKLDKGRGPVATVLVQSGTLHDGDFVVAGEHAGRVRAMYDSTGTRVMEAGPSAAVQVLGLSGIPTAGDNFDVVADDKTAKTVASHRSQKTREQELLKTSGVTLENFLKSPPKEGGHTLRLIVKADVYGSLEALASALKALSNNQVTVDVVHSSVGTITENDINLAVASKAIIIGFNVKPDVKAHALAQHEKIDVRSYDVIYNVIDDVRAAMLGLLAPVIEETYLGKAEVRALFPVGKREFIAGCYVQDGKLLRGAHLRVMRGKESVYEGVVGSLKRFKDDVREVGSGYECGIGIEGFAGVKEGDVIECFELKKVAAKLDPIQIAKPIVVESDAAAPAGA